MGRITRGSHIPYYFLVLYCIMHTLLKDKCMCVCRTSENCKSLILQDKCNNEIFLSSGFHKILSKVDLSICIRLKSRQHFRTKLLVGLIRVNKPLTYLKTIISIIIRYRILLL